MLADAMETVYPGCRELVEAVDAAASLVEVEVVTRTVQEALSHLAITGGIELSDDLRRPSTDAYARRLIHQSHDPVYTVLAMIWGPEQGTPVHDHADLWCVEGVIEGRLEVRQYDLVERRGERCRFEPQQKMDAGVGSSGRLIPPFDYHTIFNASRDDCAITIHVYGGEMSRCRIYESLEGGWYEEMERELTYSV